MFVHHHLHRIRYDECDPMGYFYHARFASLFDAARTEALRSLGLSYRRLEARGIIMPVIDVSIRYRKPLHYDDIADVQCAFPDIPAARLRTEYEVRTLGDVALRATATVTLCFVDVARNRPIRVPDRLVQVLSEVDGRATAAGAPAHPYACPICREIHSESGVEGGRAPGRLVKRPT